MTGDPTSPDETPWKIGVITLVSGRRDHLLNQYRAITSSSRTPHSYTVVAIDEPLASEWLGNNSGAEMLQMTTTDRRLPLAAARNLGAAHAIDGGADLLVFLDVDCVPTPALLSEYAAAATQFPRSLLGGAVGYLPEGVDPFHPNRDAVAHFHPFRPRLFTGEVVPVDPNLFWSLSFALEAKTWHQTGGFHEEYCGYGGEDTDFSRIAQQRGIVFRMVGGAEAFHQHHPTQSPPVQHLDDILRNGQLFKDRWGSWPMTGWLKEFEARGLVTRNEASGDWQKIGVVL
ncbi:glycosyltransferase family 2 protein [Lacisediminihabitans sp. H27-G8]|uniref:glycosyltransferase family 2 protein n=1 Tax=Lacisediminihabitans sp. H27-G8 TaxID=3111909 RepID=UPI0038FC4FCB